MHVERTKFVNRCTKILTIIASCLFCTSCATSNNPDSRVMSHHSTGNTAQDTGIRYLLGQGVRQNNQKAFYWFEQAARQDNPFAQNELAYMYATGKGTTQDFKQALYWYQQSASHDLASAEYSLGLMYLYGMGVPSNKEIAYKWFKQSAAHGFDPAQAAMHSLQ